MRGSVASMRPAGTVCPGRSTGDSTGLGPTVIHPARHRSGFCSIGPPTQSPTARASLMLRKHPDYTFIANAEGATGALSFPSALTTPHPENNVVYARYFGAPTTAKTARGRRAAAMERRRGRPCRALPPAQSIRNQRAAPHAAVSRRAQAGRAEPCRLHRERKHRPDAAGMPPGGDGRPAICQRGCDNRDTSGSGYWARASARVFRC